MTPIKSMPRVDLGKVRKLMFQIDMGKGRVSQEVIDRWEKELMQEFSYISARYSQESHNAT